MTKTNCTRGLLAASVFCCSQSLSAQQFASFGDNIADPGNIPPILEASNANSGTTYDTNFPASPPGFGNRYSNGLTAAEQLPALLGINASNVSHNAVGNAFSDKLPVSLAGGILLGNGSAIPGPIGRELTALNNTDIAAQVDGYIATSGGLSGSDTMLIYPSGNDAALALNTIALTTPSETESLTIIANGAQTNALNTAASVQALFDAGAGTVIVSNLPNIGLTPAAQAGGLSGQQLATLFSTSTNTALTMALANVDPGTGQLIVADTYALNNDIVANPEKYGFSDVTTPCSLVASCASASQAEQNQFLFWDEFFPTEAGHALAAAFIADTVNGPKTVAALNEEGRLTAESHSRSLLAARGETGVWQSIQLGSHQRKRDPSSHAAGYESQSTDLTFAAGRHRDADSHFGVSLQLSQADVDFESVTASFERQSTHLGLFGGSRIGALSLTGALSFGFDKYDDILRDTGVANQRSRADTSGDSLGVLIEVRRPMSSTNGFHGSPIARLGYSRSDIDRYSESGATGLSQSISASKLEKSFTELGAALNWQGKAVNGALSGIWHIELNGEDQAVAATLKDNNSITRNFAVANPDEDYGRVELQLDGSISDSVTWGFSASLTVDDAPLQQRIASLWLRTQW